MKKYFKYIYLILLLIFTFNINVKAAETESDKILGYSYCIYDIRDDLSVKLSIDASGSVSFYYYLSESTDKKKANQIEGSSASWLGIGTNGYVYKKNDVVKDGITSCPKYANLAPNSREVIFQNKSFSEEGASVGTGWFDKKLVEYHNEGTFNAMGNNTNGNNTEEVGPLIQKNEKEYKKCSDIINEDLAQLLNEIVSIIRIIVPIIIIVLSIVDLAIAVLGDEDKMKKAQSKFIKRLMLGVGFFLIPTLLSLLLKTAHEIWPIVSSDLCGIL